MKIEQSYNKTNTRRHIIRDIDSFTHTHQNENSLVQFNFEELRFFFIVSTSTFYIRNSRNTFEFPSNISYLYLFLICRANVTVDGVHVGRFYFFSMNFNLDLCVTNKYAISFVRLFMFNRFVPFISCLVG